MMERTLADVGRLSDDAGGEDGRALAEIAADVFAPNTRRHVRLPFVRSGASLTSYAPPPTEWLGDKAAYTLEWLGAKPDSARHLGNATRDLSQFAVLPSLADLAFYVNRGESGNAAWAAPALIPGAGGVKALARKAVGRAAELPIDEASRIARARDMGFYLEHPLAHGRAGPEFRSFDMSRAGATTGAAPAQAGVFAEWHPERGAGIADYFAQIAASKGPGNPSVMPLVHRAENPAQFRLTGDETHREILGTLLDAWDAGHDAVLMKNFTRHGGKSGEVLVVKDPAQLRAPWARFDPARKDVNDLLASLVVVPAAGVAGATFSDQQEP